MQVPLLDLKAQYATLREETQRAVNAVLESQYFVGGPEIQELEKQIAAYCDVGHAVGVSSGTDALIASLMSLGIGHGDEVITTAYTFFATVGSIWRVGAKPVFVDIEGDTYNVDTTKIEAAITPKTRAIMPVHLYGQLADMTPIMEIADKHNLLVIEDAAQGIGATQNGKKAGSFGTTGCFSFFPSKNLGGLGDGGMVVTQDEALAERLRQCRNHGMNPKYYHQWVGGNFRLDSIQAAGLLVKMNHLESWHAGRRANAAKYNSLFAGLEQIVTPTIRDYNESIYNQYIIRVPKRDECRAFLQESGVGCEVYYPVAMHQQECFQSLGYKSGDFPQSEKASQETIALPIYPELTDEQIEYVAGKVIEFVLEEK
ncbi:MAG: DegT/DnrJ/EryC1/StrS family aminotransferase [Phycisphaerae bacterium]|nr:DegT/DnrJ/EryC1/StrS family aminotransferase [Phycisphaerae bacterium]